MRLRIKRAAKASKKSVITKLDELLLKVVYMGGDFEYEILCQDGEASIAKYRIIYIENEGRRKLRNSVVLAESEVIDKFNALGIYKWDGFNGKHPRHILDGTMFVLQATVDDGRKIYARGSENFPPHYDELVSWLDELCENNN